MPTPKPETPPAIVTRETVTFVAQREAQVGPISSTKFGFSDVGRERSTFEMAAEDEGEFRARIAKAKHSSITGRTRIIERRVKVEETIIEEREA